MVTHFSSPLGEKAPQPSAQYAPARLMLYLYEDNLMTVMRESRLAAVISISTAEIDWLLGPLFVIDDRPLLVACHAHFGFTLDVYLCIGVQPFPPREVG